MSDTIRVAALDGWNPRIFAETVSTIALAHERKPRCGRHLLPFALLQEVNARWARCPAAGLACLKNADLTKINTALTILGSIQVAMVKETGTLEVLDPVPSIQPQGDGRQF